jgi:hypothetical protein
VNTSSVLQKFNWAQLTQQLSQILNVSHFYCIDAIADKSILGSMFPGFFFSNFEKLNADNSKITAVAKNNFFSL